MGETFEFMPQIHRGSCVGGRWRAQSVYISICGKRLIDLSPTDGL